MDIFILQEESVRGIFMSKSLSESLIESVCYTETNNLLANMGDMTLDLLAADDSLIKDIPFVSTACSIFRIGRSISDLHHIRQLSRFIGELNSETENEGKREEYKRLFEEKSEQDRSKELEYIVLIISHYLDSQKPRYLAKLYISYLSHQIDWNIFISYSEVINRFLPGDIKTLEMGEVVNVNDQDVPPPLLRLVGLGLFKAVTVGGSSIKDKTVYILPDNISNYYLTSFGEKMRICLGFLDRE